MQNIKLTDNNHFLYIYEKQISENDRINKFNNYRKINQNYYLEMYKKMLPKNAKIFSDKPITPMTLDMTNIQKIKELFDNVTSTMVLYQIENFLFIEEPGIFGFISEDSSAGSKNSGEFVTNLCCDFIPIKKLHKKVIIVENGKLFISEN